MDYKTIIVSLGLVISLQVLASDNLIILADHDGRPKYYEEDGEAKGFIVDITRWCLDTMKVNYVVNTGPWARLVRQANKGEGGIIGFSVSSERLKRYDYSRALFVGDLMIVVKAGSEFDYSSISDLTGKSVAVSRGTSYGDKFDNAVARGVFTLHEFSNQADGLDMVKKGRIDVALIGPGQYGLRRIVNATSRLSEQDFSILPKPFKSDTKHLAFAKTLNMIPFLIKFDECLAESEEKGIFDSLISRYLD